MNARNELFKQVLNIKSGGLFAGASRATFFFLITNVIYISVDRLSRSRRHLFHRASPLLTLYLSYSYLVTLVVSSILLVVLFLFFLVISIRIFYWPSLFFHPPYVSLSYQSFFSIFHIFQEDFEQSWRQAASLPNPLKARALLFS